MARPFTRSWVSRSADIVIPPRRRDLIVARLGNEMLVADMREGNTHHLNRTAGLVWTACDGKTLTRDIAARLSDSNDVPFDIALFDVEQLVLLFAEAGLLQETTSHDAVESTAT